MKSANSFKGNAIANYVGLGYITIIGIVILPLYLQYLGREAFGLVGFFLALQAWIQLLDMGLSPMLSRQTARTRGSGSSFLELKKLLRSIEILILVLALVATSTIISSSGWIANDWLKIENIPLSKVTICITLMAGIVGLQFFRYLYVGGIQGMEKQVLLNVINILIATLRYLGALLLIKLVSQDVVIFFWYQLGVGAVEFVVLIFVYYGLMPTTKKVQIRFYWSSLKPILPFSLGIAYATAIWMAVTQIDKVVLSKVLTLSDYGYFTLVAVVSAGIMKMTSPLSQALLPRMTNYLAQQKEREMLILYRKSTQLMAVVMAPVTGIVAFFSTELLWAWTGDKMAAEWAGPVLFWFALGNGLLAIGAFQYYLQFAHGKLRMHLIFNTVSAFIQIPIVIYTAIVYGAIGVAVAWFTLRLLTFFLWTPIVHRIFAPGMHWSWLLKDVAPAYLLTILLLVLIRLQKIDFYSMDRLELVSGIIAIGIIVMVVNMIFVEESRKLIFSMFRSLKNK